MFKLYGISKNNIEIFAHPDSHPHREDLISEVLSLITLPEDNTFFRATVDLGHIIGKDHLVKTYPGDNIVYLRRGNRAGESRMVLKEAADTSFVTIICCVCSKDETTPDELVGKWVIVTLFEGQPGEREPWDRACQNNPELKAKSEEFWANHALVPTEDEMEIIKKGGSDNV